MIELATAAAGRTESIEYNATKTGYYTIFVENDARESEVEIVCKLVALETISLDAIRSVRIEGAINKTGGWEPRLYTYYAFIFDARSYKNTTLEVKLTTPDGVDMYQMRLYKRRVKEEKIDRDYDALAAYSKDALLTDDAKKNANVEIFLGLIGFLRGSGTKEIEYVINDVIPFPNLSLRPQETAIVPEVWYETLTMYIRLKYKNSANIQRPLGCLHSHPGEVPLPTKHDENFAKAIAKDAGNAILVIVGNNNLMYAYRATDRNMKKYVYDQTISG